jgi:3-oxoacyl-[acyl-carrier-protein] synthase-3
LAIRTRIVGTGHYLPKNTVTNDDLAKYVDTTDEWVRQRTGIKQRQFAADDESSSDMGTVAAQRALENAGVAAEDVDYIICATCTPDHGFPSTACLIQHGVGATRASACDMNAACSGFIYGLEAADAFIRAGVYKTILLVGTEKLSMYLDFSKRDTAVIFGDGAGAVVIQGEDGERGVHTIYTGADGSAKDLLNTPYGGSRHPITEDNVAECRSGIIMKGRELFKRAVRAFEDGTEQALRAADIGAEDLDYFIPHQANTRIIFAAAERVGLPEEKIVINVDRVGNTSAASIPIALDEIHRAGQLKEGSWVLLAAFGAGLTWASSLIRW